MRHYARPETLAGAMALMAERPRRVLAGGTDLYPGSGAQLDGDVLDVSSIPALAGIVHSDKGLRIGACTTWTQIAQSSLPPALHALQQASLQVGGRQIQNAGTIGGNLCNASPAADGVPPLLILDAEVELTSPRGVRQVALDQFLRGSRQTDRAADEVLTAVVLPDHALTGRSAFIKLGARAYLVISIAMVAARITVAEGRIVTAALAIGACSATALRLHRVESALVGASPKDAAAQIRSADVASHLSPIDDIRASAEYRVEAATHLLQRAVAEVLA